MERQGRQGISAVDGLRGLLSGRWRSLPDSTVRQVANVQLEDRGELRKLAQQKEDVGELSAADERKYRQLQRTTERELLQVSLSHALI